MFGKIAAVLLVFAFVYCAINGFILSLIDSGTFAPGAVLIWIIIATPLVLIPLGIIIQFELKEKQIPLAAITYATLMLLVFVVNGLFFWSLIWSGFYFD